MSKSNNRITSIKSDFIKSNQQASVKNEIIITPVDSINKIHDKIALFTYLNDTYANNIKKLEIQALEKQYQQLTEKPIITALASFETVNEQKLFDYLDDAYNQNILELTAQSKTSKKNKEINVFQKMHRFFQKRQSIEADKSNQVKFQVLTK